MAICVLWRCQRPRRRSVGLVKSPRASASNPLFISPIFVAAVELGQNQFFRRLGKGSLGGRFEMAFHGSGLRFCVFSRLQEHECQIPVPTCPYTPHDRLWTESSSRVDKSSRLPGDPKMSPVRWFIALTRSLERSRPVISFVERVHRQARPSSSRREA